MILRIRIFRKCLDLLYSRRTEKRCLAGVLPHRVHMISKFERRHHLRQTYRSAEAGRAAVAHRRLTAALPASGSHQNHTIGSSGAIYRRRRSVLKHGYAFYVCRIDVPEALLHSIDKDIRTSSVYGTCTPDREINSRSRLASHSRGNSIGRNGQSGHISLQCACNIGHGSVRYFLRGNRRDGSRDGSSLLGAHSDNDRLLQNKRVHRMRLSRDGASTCKNQKDGK